MISAEDLDAAVADGLISAEQADALCRHAAQRRQAHAVDEEYVRLITGFNDVFVVIAASLLLVAVGSLAGKVSSALAAAAVAACSWGLAEAFVRRRRMALPAIALLLVFVVSAVVLGSSLLPDPDPNRYPGLALGGLLGVLGAVAHWRRFRVPITVAAGAGAAVAMAASLLYSWNPQAHTLLLVLVFLAGAGVFGWALHWDAQDPQRRSGRSDVAFWLHVLAAPLMVHPVFALIGIGSGGDTLGWLPALWALGIYGVIGLVSLAIDRRALLVSALGYVLYTLTQLLKGHGLADQGFALTAGFIGLGLLLLSVFWHRCREAALSQLPPALRARLAH